MTTRIVARENNRHGSRREPVASTIVTPPKTAPLESARQRRALRGPKRLSTAITTRQRDAWAYPVQVLRPADAPKGTRRKRHTPPPGLTRNVGGSTPQPYVYGTGSERAATVRSLGQSSVFAP